VAVETLFNVLCLWVKVSVPPGTAASTSLFDHLFAAFFVLQVGGFALSEWRMRRYDCLAASLCMGVGLAWWFLHGTGTTVTASGQIHFWGGDAPVWLRWMYVSWVTGILLLEQNRTFPKVTIQVVHLASVAVAFSSGEFFHARILSASHLFVLNFVFLYESRGWGGEHFALLPTLSRVIATGPSAERARRVIGIAVNLVCVGLLVMWMAET